jgi:phosphoserine/homoserine phosphotransferase
MHCRLDKLAQHNLKLADIQNVISGMDPLPGALEFTNTLRERTQLVILSDTFEQFAKPLMEKLSWPCLFCNSLITGPDGGVTGYKLRQANGKREAVKAFKSMNMSVFAGGDSFNDLAMIREADSGCLFRAPESIRKDCTNIPCVDTYEALLAEIDRFLKTPFHQT